jgi:hypothetical protein
MTADSDFGALLGAMARADPVDVADLVALAGRTLEASDVVLYLVDFEQQVLEPVTDGSGAPAAHPSEEVGTTLPGRAFLQRQVVTAERPEGLRVWAPVLEGSDVTGVLGLTVARTDEALMSAAADLGVMAGYLLATHARVTDLYGRYRRRRAMTLAASMQWDLLPPLTLTSSRVLVAGMLEPAYEVGGDCFDYALNGDHLEFAFMDSMGHGLRSALVAALAVGCYRHQRREGRSLEDTHRTLDEVLGTEYRGEAFVTGQMGRLDLVRGELSWTNAGHPRPMLIRRGRVVGLLEGGAGLPWGIGPAPVTVRRAPLEPGDSVLFYTDGVVDSRSPRGEDFGIDRLTDLVGRFSSDEVPVPLIVRHLVRAVLEHHGGQLSDDATVLMIHWPGPLG